MGLFDGINKVICRLAFGLFSSWTNTATYDFVVLCRTHIFRLFEGIGGNYRRFPRRSFSFPCVIVFPRNCPLFLPSFVHWFLLPDAAPLRRDPFHLLHFSTICSRRTGPKHQHLKKHLVSHAPFPGGIVRFGTPALPTFCAN